MSRPRNKKFGPVTYAALLAWGLVALYSGVEFASPRMESWLEQRRILKTLRSPDIKTRQQLVQSLETKGPTFAKAYLLEAASDPSFDVSIAACRQLANQGAESGRLIPVLSAAAGDENIDHRVESARILGRILAGAAGEIRSSADNQANPAAQFRSQSVAVLYRLLKDRAPEARAAAADSLGNCGIDSSVTAELIAAAGDPDRGVRLAIAQALLRINGPGDRTAAGILASLAADRESDGQRSLAMNALQQASEETRNRAMLAMANLLPHADSLVQQDVLACLGTLGPRARCALPALEKLLNDRETDTRTAAMRAILDIEESRSPRLIMVMLEMISDKSSSQEWRMELLGRIKETSPTAVAKATPSLIRQLGDDDPNVRRAALELLAFIIEDTRAEMPTQAAAR
jgi:HEAT repeat protein